MLHEYIKLVKLKQSFAKCEPQHAGLGKPVSKLFSILIHILYLRIENKINR